jgi:hypothetical protein
MKFIIKGADHLTGADRAIEIQADSEADAEIESRRMGILVSSVTPCTAFEPMAAARKRMMAAGPRENPTRLLVPEYGALKFVASILFVQALLLYTSASLALTVGLFATVTPGSHPDSHLPDPQVLLVFGLSALLSGGVIHGFSQACLALRDIARNSFKS